MKSTETKSARNGTKQPLLSLGSTLLNLAVSSKPQGAIPPGTYVFMVGDSASGKTFLSLTAFAEALRSKHFKDHRLIYDDVEGGAMMDWEKFFGKSVAAKVEPPSFIRNTGTVGDVPEHSETLEDFYYNIDDAIQDGRPFIYVLDSMDGLTTGDDVEKFKEAKDARRKGKDVGGSYGTSKAKTNSVGMRQVIRGLKKTGSILIVLCQTRENIGFGSQFNPKTRAGGRALTFYAHSEIWFSLAEQIKKTVKGKPRQLGVISRIQIKKNRISGKLREVRVPIYWSLGIDDVQSCVDYLIDEGYWAEKKGSIEAKEFGFKGTMDKLIGKIESENLEKELKAIVSECWQEIESACEQPRKMRYQ